MHKITKFFVAILLIQVISGQLTAQDERCGTTHYLKNQFEKNPLLQETYRLQNERITAMSEESDPLIQTMEDTIYLPVVFHLLLTNQSLVTDQQVQAQLDRLNEDFAGKNADSVLIPSYFQSVRGRAVIQFRLAQRTPDLQNTNGIIRYPNALSSYNVNQSRLYYTAQGGADVWNPNDYINIWVASLQGDILGQATYPGMADPAEDGIVIHYGSMPGGALAPYNMGKTLTHEMGHYLFLIHIWGDDGGTCTGSDYVEDTPNQADYTSGCPNGIVTDICTPGGNGIMYQNYMDYSNDACLVLFTHLQVERMMQALTQLRPSLMISKGASPMVNGANNAAVTQLTGELGRVCSSAINTSVVFQNVGANTITTLEFAVILNGVSTLHTISTNIASLGNYTFNIPVLNINPGSNTLSVEIRKVNGVDDEDASDNIITRNMTMVQEVTLPFYEDFSGTGFPPDNWYIDNPDAQITWEHYQVNVKGGVAGINLYNYQSVGQQDRLVLPPVRLPDADTIFFGFDVAAALYSSPQSGNTIWDTLFVELSTGCDAGYQILYTKAGTVLATLPAALSSDFVPTTVNQWRRDSIDLSNFAGQTVSVAFRVKNGWENNIYIDNVGFRAVLLPEVLKAQGVMVAPNPVTDIVTIRLLENPVRVNRIALYDISGRLLATHPNIRNTVYQFDLTNYPRGLYFVRVETDKITYTAKIIKN